MKKHNLVNSFNCAIEGFIYALRTQKNMKFHFMVGVAVLILGIFMHLGRVEILILTLSICFVLFAEMLNTCVELTVDLITTHAFHPLARVIKDIGAGMVLISSLNAVIVGYLFFLKPLVSGQFKFGLQMIHGLPWHVTFICLVLVVAFVIALKLFFHKGTPLQGGMPSGHAAVSFSIWTAVTIMAQNEFISFLVFLLAFLVAKSRIVKGIHTSLEVIVGALLGMLVTFLVFQLLW